MNDVLVCVRDPQLFILLRHVLAAEGFTAITTPERTGTGLISDGIALIYEWRCQPEQPLSAFDENLPLMVLCRDQGPVDIERRGATLILRGPFDPSELLTFLRHHRRSSKALDSDIIRFKDIAMNMASHRVDRDGKTVSLTALQFRLLRELMTAPERVIGREELIEICWPPDSFVEPRTVDIHIGEIRRRLAKLGDNYIQTVRGAGYCLSIHDRD